MKMKEERQTPAKSEMKAPAHDLKLGWQLTHPEESSDLAL